LVELMEYLLVFGVTVSLAGFSVMVFGGFLPTVNHTVAQTEVDQIAGAASLAAENGSASLVLTFTNASISCSQGVVELSTGGQAYSSDVTAGSCGFGATDLTGVCKLVFTSSDGLIGLEVDS
jgi:hypothetical protein